MSAAWMQVQADDLEALQGLLEEEAAGDPAFSTFIEAGRSAAENFLSSAESLGSGARVSKEDLAVTLRSFVKAEAATSAFAAAAPLVLENLRRSIEAQLPPDTSLPALLGDQNSEAANEIRNLYRTALAVDAEPLARDLVVERSANGAARGLTADFPEIWAMVSDHVDSYGWVRTVFTTLDPLTPKEVLQRIQIALLRWDRATIALAAEAPAAPQPPGGIRKLVDAYGAVSGELAFSPGLGVKARWVARSFFHSVAEAIGSSYPQLSLATSDEILSALESGTGLHQGSGPETEDRSPLTGQSVSLGRAVGRVRVILDADDGGRLKVGDILVTNLSTPTYEGEPSLFPYRTVPAVAVDKAGAIIADEGGLLSHAAIICRENQVPSILGAEGASETLTDGMIVEVDATRSTGKVAVIQP